MGAVILVVVPVLGRPQNAQPLVDSFKASGSEARLTFVCSPNDQEQINACEATGVAVLWATWEPGPADFARKINLAYRVSTEPWVFQAADDVRFQPGWDVEVLRVAEETGASVVGTNDDANPGVKAGRHSTHTLIRRSYIDDPGASMDGPGLVFSEAYGHQWVDNELVDLAKARGEWAFAKMSVVRHHHPIFDRSVTRDATYELGDSTRREDYRTYQRRSRLWRERRVA